MSALLSDPRAFLTEMFLCAVAEADPMRVIARHLPPRPAGRILVIGAGKASARMAAAVEQVWGPCDGYVITRYGYACPTQKITIVEAAHPVPDAVGLAATEALMKRVQGLGPDDLVLALISGGGSALLCAPADGLTLADKQAVNAALLASGAPISDMNVVRKQLSRVKGGKLAALAAPARVHSLLISDIPGDDPSLIASGPTVPDLSTPEQALAVIARWKIAVPAGVLAALHRPAVNTPVTATASIIAAPSQSLAAVDRMATAAGCHVLQLGDALEGEARDLAATQARRAIELAATLGPKDRPILMISGGECTVTKRGDGVGGPNAEFTLAAALALGGHPRIHVMACDTDGVDGAAEVAGAYAAPDTLATAAALGIDAAAALARNDAHGFFGAIHRQVITGPTMTNVNDFRAFLIYPPAA